MIFFFEDGRLGNQLFQYFGVTNYFKGHKIFFFGFKGLRKVIDVENISFVGGAKSTNWFGVNWLKRFFELMAALHIIGTIAEARRGADYSIVAKKGILRKAFLLKASFFQHESATSQIPQDVKLHPSVVIEAERWLVSNNIEVESLVFVHVRRGDYLYWPSACSPAVLPCSWYEAAMKMMAEKIDKPIFLVVTDDPYYAEDVWGGRPGVFISYNKIEIDLALMSKCSHGILSASSFAWWGAWLSKINNYSGDVRYYVAPKYWAGHRIAQWYPEGFFSKWITYI